MLTREVANYLKKALKVDKLPLPTIEALPRPLLEISEQIAALTGSWNPVEIFTPHNARVEKIKFIEAFHAKQVYNPQFVYPYAENLYLGESRKKLNRLLYQVRQFVPHSQIERIARVALYFKIKDDLATCDLVEGLQLKNEEQIGRALKEKYPGTHQELLKIAEANYISRISGNIDKKIEQQGILTQQELLYLRDKEFDACEIKKAFTWAIEKYGMLRLETDQKGFVVTIDEKVTAIDVRDKSVNGPTIYIPADSKVNGIDLIKLIGHEIDGHARQSVNGETLFLIGGGALKIDSEILYEGLAKRYDDFLSKKLFGIGSGVPMPYYTYAVYAAEKGWSFNDIFRDQLNMRLHVALKKLPEENLPYYTQVEGKIFNEAIDRAWVITYRIMRGHVNTANPYSFAMAKDLAYLWGYIIDKQLVEMGIGHANESAIMATGSLQLLAEFSLTADSLPLPYQDVATKYLEKLLKL